MKLLAILFFLVTAPAAMAHGGEDHGHAETPVITSGMAPRFTATSEDFELVGVLADGKLTLYLDRRASNEPVSDATIEVESGKFKAVAVVTAPATYQVSGDSFRAPGKYPLTVTVQTNDGSDLLAAALETSTASVAPDKPHVTGQPSILAAAALLTIAALGWIGVQILRRRRNGAKA